MLLSAHQPVYLPWLGLFHKIAVGDQFVIFDVVPYSRKMFYNRNSILGPDGPIKLSVPVRFSQKDAQLHRDVTIDNAQPWQRKHWGSIVHCYGKTPYFDDYGAPLEPFYTKEWERLADLNAAMLDYMLDKLGIDTPMRRASEFELNGQKSSLVLNMCRAFEADTYLFGTLGRDYADIDQFLTAGVVPLFQDYRHPEYPQFRDKPFIPFMSALDLMCRCGPNSLEILMSGNDSRESYLEESQALRSGATRRE